VEEHCIPRALTKQDIKRICQDYIRAAQNAKDAGFDGVELHAAHGYLIDQFLNSSSNQRDDEYGGSKPENRCRFLGDVLDAILQVWPADRVGVRLSPHDSPNGGYTYYGARDDNPDAVYSHAVSLINSKGVAYLLLTEPRWVGKHDSNPESDPGFQMPLLNLPKYRPLFRRNEATGCGVLIGAGGFTPTSSMAETCQDYDALGFGRWFLANPDLPERLKQFHQQANGGDVTAVPPLNRYDRDTFYSQGAQGYIDYPSMDFDGNVQNPKQEGMILGKYALVKQEDVGTSLKSAKQQQQRRSKL
jgi:2,4-dienoyl-CoA reductase-like NADH-dependent reductase (Old Yellow Enzyme family)